MYMNHCIRKNPYASEENPDPSDYASVYSCTVGVNHLPGHLSVDLLYDCGLPPSALSLLNEKVGNPHRTGKYTAILYT